MTQPPAPQPADVSPIGVQSSSADSRTKILRPVLGEVRQHLVPHRHPPHPQLIVGVGRAQLGKELASVG